VAKPSVSLPKRKWIEVSDLSGDEETVKNFIVDKMPIGRYSEFWQELSKIPKTISNIVKMLFNEPVTKEDFRAAATERGDDEHAEEIAKSEEITNNQLIEAVFALPEILTEHWDDLVSALAIASGIDEKDLRQLDLDEGVQVIEAVIEVNNFFGVGDRCRELMGRKQAAQQAQMTVPNKRKAKKKN